MFGWKTRLMALALVAWFAGASSTPAEAQGVVPGGWSSAVGFQSFVGPGVAGTGGYLGYGYGVTVPGYAPYGGGLVGPYGPAVRPSYNYYTPSSQTVNAVDPLIGAIRRNTGRKTSR